MVSWFGVGDFGVGDYSSATEIPSAWAVAAGQFDGRYHGRVTFSAQLGVAPGYGWGRFHGQARVAAIFPVAPGYAGGSTDWQLRVVAHLEPAPGVLWPGSVAFGFYWSNLAAPGRYPPPPWDGEEGSPGPWAAPVPQTAPEWSPVPQDGPEWAISAPSPAAYQDAPPPVYDAGHLLTPTPAPAWATQTAVAGTWGSPLAPVSGWLPPPAVAEPWNEVERDNG